MSTRKPLFLTRRAAVFATALATIAGAAVAAGPANADGTPNLSVSVSTSNTTVSGQQLPFISGTVYALTYALTDNESAKMTDVSFTDQLPAGLVVAPGSTATASNCGQQPNGQPNTAQAEPGATNITESGFTVFPGTGQGCDVELFVVAATSETTVSDTPGSATFTYDGKTDSTSASGSSSTGATVQFPTWNVSVVAPPTFAITYPANGATVGFNKNVDVQLSATPAVGDAVTDLYAVDENNDVMASGQAIPTEIPGTHTLTVWAQTGDGFIGSSSQTVKYTVGSPQPVEMVSHPLGSLSFDVKYLAIGTATATLTYGSTVLSSVKKWVHVGHEMPMWLAPNAAAEQILSHHRNGIKATLSIEYRVWSYHSFASTPVNVIQNVEIH